MSTSDAPCGRFALAHRSIKARIGSSSGFSAAKEKWKIMNETNSKIESAPARVDRWLDQAAEATISEEDLERLLRVCLLDCTGPEVATDESLQRRLQAAINSYCHIVRITREYRDADVDLETSRGLLAKLRRREPFTDADIRLLGKRSSNSEANTNLWNICGWLANLMADDCQILERPYDLALILGTSDIVDRSLFKAPTDEQCSILAESLFEQAVVHGTSNITDRAYFAAPRKSPDQEKKLLMAHGISLLTERYDSALRYAKLSPEQKAREDQAVEQLYRAVHGLPPDGPENA